MFIGVCVSCHISFYVVSYLYEGFGGLITSVGEERKRELNILLSISCNYVVSVERGFFFLLVLRLGCVMWHSLGLPILVIILTFSSVHLLGGFCF